MRRLMGFQSPVYRKTRTNKTSLFLLPGQIYGRTTQRAAQPSNPPALRSQVWDAGRGLLSYARSHAEDHMAPGNQWCNVNWRKGKDEIMLYDCPAKITSWIIIKGHWQGRLLNVHAFIVSSLQGGTQHHGARADFLRHNRQSTFNHK